MLLSMMRKSGIRVVGCISPRPPDQAWFPDVPWLGRDADLSAIDPSEYVLVNGIGSTGSTDTRAKAFDRARSQGYTFIGIRSAAAMIDADVELPPDVQIMPGAIIRVGASIGRNVLLNSGAVIEHDATIGDHCHVASRATLGGGVTLSEGVHVGIGSTVLQNVSIGRGAIVGGGALVAKDVPDGVTVVGVPARIVTGKTKG